MSIEHCILPEHYRSLLNQKETQMAIKLVKDTFERKLADNLRLIRVSAPLFVEAASGLNDNLNGVERPVHFDVKETQTEAEIVHSLAKWKRLALKQYDFGPGEGLYTDMNAIRRDEDLDNLHSIYVDQWDWEKIILRPQRTLAQLEETVRLIVRSLKETDEVLCANVPQITPIIEEKVKFITSQELLDRYPSLTAKQREDAITKEYGTVFIEQIGGQLSNGQPHDGRAPDYDDWQLNGDLLIWDAVLNRAMEISSMGIRVDEASMIDQLNKAGCPERSVLPFHRALLAGDLPLTMGGGIGQSRICMLLLHKAHIGEVQASLWPPIMRKLCHDNGIELL